MKNHFEIHKKEPFFVENEEKYKEMLDNINKMKNMVLDFDNSKFVYKGIKETITNVVNNINSTASGAETNLSCSMSSNEEPKESFYNNSNDSQEKIKNNKNKILNEKNEKKEKDKDYDGTNIIKNDINSNKGQININEFDPADIGMEMRENLKGFGKEDIIGRHHSGLIIDQTTMKVEKPDHVFIQETPHERKEENDNDQLSLFDLFEKINNK